MVLNIENIENIENGIKVLNIIKVENDSNNTTVIDTTNSPTKHSKAHRSIIMNNGYICIDTTVTTLIIRDLVELDYNRLILSEQDSLININNNQIILLKQNVNNLTEASRLKDRIIHNREDVINSQLLINMEKDKTIKKLKTKNYLLICVVSVVLILSF